MAGQEIWRQNSCNLFLWWECLIYIIYPVWGLWMISGSVTAAKFGDWLEGWSEQQRKIFFDIQDVYPESFFLLTYLLWESGMFQTHAIFKPISFSIQALFFNYYMLRNWDFVIYRAKYTNQDLTPIFFSDLNPYKRTRSSHFLWDPMISCGLNSKIQQAKVSLSLLLPKVFRMEK